MQGVIIGVDPHKLSATIEVVDSSERLLGSGRFTTDKAGYAALGQQAPHRRGALRTMGRAGLRGCGSCRDPNVKCSR